MKRVPQGLHLHFDPISGIAGDMTIAALVDIGVPRSVITSAIAAMKVPGLKVSFERRQRGAYVGVGFLVHMPGERRGKGQPDPGHAAESGEWQGHMPDHGHDHDHDHDHGHDHDHDEDHVHEHDHDHVAIHDHDHDHVHDHDHDHDDDHDHGHDHDGAAGRAEAGHDHDHDDDLGCGHDHDHGDHDHDNVEDAAGEVHDHDHDDSGHDHDDEGAPVESVPAVGAARGRARGGVREAQPAARSASKSDKSIAAGKRQPASKHSHVHRDYAEIRRLLKRAKLDPDVKALAAEIFARIAEAESQLHGVPLDRIGFHEVGAYDSIADIIGVAAAIVWLAPASITSSPPVLGSGHIRTAHGPVPVPAPATALLLEGIPVSHAGRGELTTPTGAAILATVVDSFGAAPPMRLLAQGFGAGTKDFPDRANVLRVLLGEPLGDRQAPSASEVTLIETNVDDMNPQLVTPLIEALLDAGAVDAWATPILMKKGRPALTLSALSPAAAVEAVTLAFFEHSSTIGVRTTPLARTALERSSAIVKTRHGKVAVKLSAWQGRVLSATPEFDDCRRLAKAAKVPVRTVMAAAAAAAESFLAPGAPKRR